MAGTLGDMKARIAAELGNRTDLATQIASAINDAIGVYAQERFAFSEVPADGTVTFNTVAGQSIYTAADNVNLGTLLQIDGVTIDVGSASVFSLERDTPENVLLYNQQGGTMVGLPTWYAFENGRFMLASAPDKAYAVKFALFMNMPAPANDAAVGNVWMTTAERLIRARAKFEIATHVTRNPTMKVDMSPDPPMENGGVVGATYREWKRMKGTANRATARGIIRPMQF